MILIVEPLTIFTFMVCSHNLNLTPSPTLTAIFTCIGRILFNIEAPEELGCWSLEASMFFGRIWRKKLGSGAVADIMGIAFPWGLSDKPEVGFTTALAWWCCWGCCWVGGVEWEVEAVGMLRMGLAATDPTGIFPGAVIKSYISKISNIRY